MPGLNQQTEVESLVELVRTQVGSQSILGRQPHLADEVLRFGVGIAERPPGAVDLVHLRLIPHRMVVAVAVVVGQCDVLDIAVGHVDPEAVDSAVEPEPQHVQELGSHLGVAPVEVGLGAVEGVEVPLPRCAVGLDDSRPGGTAEDALPVVGRQFTVDTASVPEEEAGTFRAAGAGLKGGPEPGMVGRAVVGHHVHQHPQTEAMRLGDDAVEVGQRAVGGVDGAIVGDVVAVVALRRGVARVQPDGVAAQVRDVGQPQSQAGKVADAVRVGVTEGAQVHLVDHSVARQR